MRPTLILRQPNEPFKTKHLRRVAPRGERGGLLGRDGRLTLDELGCRAEDSTELAGGADETGPLAGVEGVEGGRGRVEIDVRGVHFVRLRGGELGDVGKG